MRWSFAETPVVTGRKGSPSANRWADVGTRLGYDPLLMPEGPFAERYYVRRARDKDTREIRLFAGSAPIAALMAVWMLRGKLAAAAALGAVIGLPSG